MALIKYIFYLVLFSEIVRSINKFFSTPPYSIDGQKIKISFIVFYVNFFIWLDMLIYYWCPFLTKIATIKSVINSISSFKKYNLLGRKIDLKIINSYGEWNDEIKKNNLESLKLTNINLHQILPKKGLLSRFSLLIISILNFFPLLFIVKKNKPDYLVIHLLTSLPIVMSNFWGNKTKVILRISGLPKLNFLRKFIWKFLGKKIYLVTTPTSLTKNI